MRLSGFAVILVLSGCSVGPDVVPADVDLPESFDNAPAAQAEAVLPAAAMWQSLGNEELNLLIERALAGNTTILQALATLDETRALSGLAVYSLFPTVTVNGEVDRSRASTEDPFAFPDQGLVERYRAGFDATWEIDLFGSLRRQAESFRYLVDADAADAHAVRIAIVAEVAQAYFEWQGESLRLEILRANLKNQADSVAILDAGLDAGRGTAFDVARARAIEYQIASSVPTAEAAVSAALQRLGVLTRTPVDVLRAELTTPTGPTSLPPLVAVGTPEDWLVRRPDVRAAELRLASATADIGVAVAEYYPKLNLVGDFGWTGLESSSIGDSDAERWRVAPALSWRILDAGRVNREVKAARARAARALAAFDEAWLVALEETENALANYRATTERAARLELALDEAGEAARLANLRYQAGVDSYLDVLDAERTRIELDDLLAQGRTDRATALAALFKALGGDFAVAR